MGDFLRKLLIISACASLFLVCSCEKHSVGEDPEFQKEHADTGQDEGSAATNEADQTPGPSPKPTPGDFFPETTPH